MTRNAPRRGSSVFVLVLSFVSRGGRRVLFSANSRRSRGLSLTSAFVAQQVVGTGAIPRSLSVSSSPSLDRHRYFGGGNSWRVKAKDDNGNDEPRTGWLHNTEPKEYYRRGNNPPSADFKHDTTNKDVAAPFFSLTQSITASDDNNMTTPSFTTSKSYDDDGAGGGNLNHRIIAPPSFHPCDGTTKFMVTEHKITVPLFHADLELAAATNTNISITALDRNAIVSDMKTAPTLSDNSSCHRLRRATIDVYFAVIETTTFDNELFLASISDTTMCPRKRADAYLMRRDVNSGGGGCVNDNGSSSIDASRMMLYLQGGPGFGCAAPSVGLGLGSSSSSWAAKALSGGGVTNTEGKTFERIVLLDQRGTGRSTPISKRQLETLFPDLFLLDGDGDDNVKEDDTHRRTQVSKALADATEYLAKFRADSIVRDAEWIKEALIRHPLPPSVTESGGEHEVGAFSNVEDAPPQPRPWGAALGQSYGGFCLMTYLSSIAHPPKLCLFTGGIAPAYTPVREVYDRLWNRVATRNYKYYHHYPGDVRIVKRIVRRLLSSSMPPVKLPSGGILTARRFLQLGLGLGGSPGTSFANLHSLISWAFLHDDDDFDELAGAFLKRIDHEQSFDDAPLYFLLHESIYADGPMSGPTEWAAHSSYENIIVSSHSEFDYRQTSMVDDHNRPTLFFGEMVFPWMAHGDYAELSGHGMKSLSEALAKKRDWSPLYNKINMRAALIGGGSANMPPKCKAASATYYDDMYVDFDCAIKLLGRGAPLDGVKVWITNQFQHSGLRDDGANILCRLVNMAKENVHIPS